MAVPREILLDIAEPTTAFGELRYAQVGASPRIISVAAGGTIENTAQIVALLREVADALEADACGG